MDLIGNPINRIGPLRPFLTKTLWRAAPGKRLQLAIWTIPKTERNTVSKAQLLLRDFIIVMDSANNAGGPW